MATGAEGGVTEEERKGMVEEAGGVVGEGMGGEGEVEVGGRIEEEKKGEVGGKRERVGKDLVGSGEAANNSHCCCTPCPSSTPCVHPFLCEVVEF